MSVKRPKRAPLEDMPAQMVEMELQLPLGARSFWTDEEVLRALGEGSVAMLLKIRDVKLSKPLSLQRPGGGRIRGWLPQDVLWIHLAYDLSHHANIAVQSAAQILKRLVFEDLERLLQAAGFMLISKTAFAAGALTSDEHQADVRLASWNPTDDQRADASLLLVDRRFVFMRGTETYPGSDYRIGDTEWDLVGTISVGQSIVLNRVYLATRGNDLSEFTPAEIEASHAWAHPTSRFEFNLTRSLNNFIERHAQDAKEEASE
jgi:hypothetical protein